jgi:hypothetical protein
MKNVTAVITVLRILFGVLALAAALILLLVDGFLFDAPGSGNIWVWNLAAAPLIYILVYVYSLLYPEGKNGQPPTAGARLRRALTPVWGVAWYCAAWIAIERICHGNFSC